jgi:general secretion pathway protein F
MPSFAYRAADAQGRILRGTDEAATALEVESKLTGRGLYPLEVSGAAEAPPRRGSFRSRRADVVGAIRHLATLVEADFPLDRALGTVVRVASRAEVREALADVRARVRAGDSLGGALAEHPHIFPRLSVGMVQAGDRGGHLAEALGRLAAQLEREQALRSRLLSALLYPAVMLTVGAGAVVILFVYVLPRLVGILLEASIAVPRSTALLMALSGFLAAQWPLLLGTGVFTAILGTVAYRSDSGRLAAHRLLLRTPLVGGLRQRLCAVRLGQSLATLLGSGFPVVPALEIAALSLTDRAAAEDIRLAREEVRAGARLAQALGRSQALPVVFMQMVDVGESGGRLPMMLQHASLAMEQELERSLERLTRLAEPILILLFGGLVAFVAVALLQAIYGVQVNAL